MLLLVSRYVRATFGIYSAAGLAESKAGRSCLEDISKPSRSRVEQKGLFPEAESKRSRTRPLFSRRNYTFSRSGVEQSDTFVEQT
ncbi:MAG: hypothetical protein V4541_13905 [Bacteroidota bacterium]